MEKQAFRLIQWHAVSQTNPDTGALLTETNVESGDVSEVERMLGNSGLLKSMNS